LTHLHHREALFNKLKALETEQRNPDTLQIDVADSLEIVSTINREDQGVALAVKKRLKKIALAVEMVRESLLEGGRLIYAGAGTSGRLGVLDAAECPPTFGTAPDQIQGFIAGGRKAMFVAQEGVEDHPETGAEDMIAAKVDSRDIVCGLAASGRTPYVLGAIEEASRRGCRTLFVTTVPAERVVIPVDLIIDIVVGPEVVMGSTRMKSATAQKMVLNMITTGAMIRMGKIYQNVMVDLMLTNRKLSERAKRILMMLTDCSYNRAEELLELSDGHVKTALVMELAGIDRQTAAKRLKESEGFIRKALQR